jgi:hypothetical protein
MSLMLAKLYTALKDAGASEATAEAAAAEVAGYENRLTGVEGELRSIRSELSTIRWVLGYLVASVTAILFKVFS